MCIRTKNVQFHIVMKCRFDLTSAKTNIYIESFVVVFNVVHLVNSTHSMHWRYITFGIHRVQCVMCNLVILQFAAAAVMQRMKLPRKDN